MLSHDEFMDYFQQLQNLQIRNGSMIRYVLEDDEAVHRFEFLQQLKYPLLRKQRFDFHVSTATGNDPFQPNERVELIQDLRFKTVTLKIEITPD
ncbi:hypothetical protein V6N12_057559 [Hibiscus sabdariffa]|uniref:Uncharacterized protein n=1 Tax=Hibiscus sabdariffa TaxID=183260 RepID=A0ABR2C5T5_9ROSI